MDFPLTLRKLLCWFLPDMQSVALDRKKIYTNVTVRPAG
jgi:hypothetical protein